MKYTLLLLVLLSSSCAVMKVSEQGQNGLIKATKQAIILRSDKID